MAGVDDTVTAGISGTTAAHGFCATSYHGPPTWVALLLPKICWLSPLAAETRTGHPPGRPPPGPIGHRRRETAAQIMTGPHRPKSR